MQRNLMTQRGLVVAVAGCAAILVAGGAARMGGHTWIGGQDLLWLNANNWQPNQVPGTDAAGVNVMIPSASGVIQCGSAYLSLGELQIDTAVRFAGTQVLTHGGYATDIELASDASLIVQEALDMYGTLSWTYGAIDGTAELNIKDSMVISALSSPRRLYTKLNNLGTVTQNGYFTPINGGSVANLSEWILASSGTANINPDGTGGIEDFLNIGTLKRTGAGSTEIWSVFVNQAGGSVECNAGEIAFKVDNIHQGGTYKAFSSGVIRFAPDTSVTSHMDGDTTFEGTGTVRVSSGGFRVWPGRTVTNRMQGLFAGQFVLQTTGTGMIFDGTFRNEGYLIWDSGTISGGGTFENGAGATAVLTSPGTLKMLFQNQTGSTTQHSGNLFLDGGDIQIDPGSQWDMGANAAIYGSGAGGEVYNEGSLGTSLSPTQYAIVGAPLMMVNGNLHIQTDQREPDSPYGGMRLLAGGDFQGGENSIITATDVSQCIFSFGTFTFPGNVVASGKGEVNVASSAVLDFTKGRLTVDSGELTVTGAQLRSPSLHDCIVNNAVMSFFGGSIGTAAGPSVKVVNNGGAFLYNSMTLRGWFENNAGHTARYSGGTLTINAGTIVNRGDWQMLSGTVNGSFGGMFRNEAGGVVRQYIIGGSTINAPLDNKGTVFAESGNLTIGNPLQMSGNTLTGGTWIASPTAQLIFSGAQVKKIGPGASVQVNGIQSQQFLNSLETIDVGGALDLTGVGPDQQTVTLPHLQETNGNLRVNGNVTAASALGEDIEGDIDMVLNLAAQGGTGTGPRLVTPLAANSGRLRPGGPGAAGPFTLQGNLVQQAAGKIQIELGGLAPVSGHDQMAVEGNVQLGGILELSLLNGFSPDVGDEFTVLTSTGTITGSFAQVLSKRAGTYGVQVRGNQVVATLTAAYIPADLNGDGIVDGADLGTLLGAWGSGDENADLNNDGIVDGADLGALLGSWSSN